MTTQPLHPHHPGKVETDAVVSTAGATGRQFRACSHCRSTIHSRVGYQGEPCDFQLCSNCDKTQGYAHPAHVLHFLHLMNLKSEVWRCNACEKTSKELKATTCYVCDICKFYLCKDCFEPKKFLLHNHALTKTDSTCVYPAFRGGWKCDVCGGNNGHGNHFPRHCNACKFDLCDKCCEPRRSTLHLHDLYKADTMLVYSRFNGGWRCDNCATRFHPTINKYPYHCNTCEFDLCEDCMRITDHKAPRMTHAGHNNYVNYRSAMSRTEAGFPVTSPEEDMVQANQSIGTVSRKDDAKRIKDDALCIICLTEPKNATLIHGDTGHVCCCITCARELERRRNPCPICRKPIQLIIQHSFA